MIQIENWQATYDGKDITNEPILDYVEQNEDGIYEPKTL
jgi:hypothetical protein